MFFPLDANKLRDISIHAIEHKIVIHFLTINLNMCFECSKELSHRGGSFEYPQHTLW